MKTCTKCKEGKPFDGFHKSKTGKYGLHSQCILCRKKQVLEKKSHYHEYYESYRKSLTEEQLEKRRASGRKSKKNNPAKYAAKEMRRKAIRLQATPSWSNKKIIDDYYLRAACWSKLSGEQFEVDHIVPLKSKFVCGLHCETNLRIISGRENRVKGNRYWPGMSEPEPLK